MNEQALRLINEQKERLVSDQAAFTRWMYDTLEERTDRAAAYGIDVRRSRRILEKAGEELEREEFKRAMDRLREGLEKLESEISQGAEGLLLEQTLTGLLLRGEACQVDVEHYKVMLEQARSAGTGTSKLYYLRQAIDELEKLVEIHEEVFRMADQVSQGIARLQEEGKDPARTIEYLDRAKMAKQPENALHFLRLSLEALNEEA